MGTFDPSIRRNEGFEHQAVKSAARLEIVEIEPLGRTCELFDITTGTGDFIANGVISHNCYARPSHQYLNLSAGLDFETQLFYKKNAAAHLREELSRRSYNCSPINLGANTDPYQPLERKLGVTRSILEVLAEAHHPVTIVTKGALVVRDLDVLERLAAERLVKVFVSVTTLDDELKRRMEPRAASPRARLAAIGKLAEAGIPAGLMYAPVVPAINDHELEAVLEASAAQGATTAGYVLLRLPGEVKELFYEWLELHYPDRAQKVRNRIRECAGVATTIRVSAIACAGRGPGPSSSGAVSRQAAASTASEAAARRRSRRRFFARQIARRDRWNCGDRGVYSDQRGARSEEESHDAQPFRSMCRAGAGTATLVLLSGCMTASSRRTASSYRDRRA